MPEIWVYESTNGKRWLDGRAMILYDRPQKILISVLYISNVGKENRRFWRGSSRKLRPKERAWKSRLDALADAIARRVVELQRGEDARLMRIKEAAAYMGVSRRTLEGLMSTGRIPTVREGSLVRLDRQDLDQWIQFRKARM
jgi:excisionase family DNA binding protein